jgi:AcrR family transcriptional regulator
MARMSPDDRRAAIIAAARAVIARRGIAATTVRDVAAELGTSSGLIHHYFTSMDDLLATAFTQAAGEDLAATVAAVRSGGTSVEKLTRFLSSYSRGDGTPAGSGGSDPGGMQMWLDAWSEAARRPAVRRASRTLNVAWHGLLVEVIIEGIAEGTMASDDPDASAWRILSLLDGLALQAVAHGDVITAAQAEEWGRTGAHRELVVP